MRLGERCSSLIIQRERWVLLKRPRCDIDGVGDDDLKRELAHFGTEQKKNQPPVSALCLSLNRVAGSRIYWDNMQNV